MNTKNNRRIIGFTSTTANTTAAPRIKNVTDNVLNCYSLSQWETAFKKYWPRVKKLVKFLKINIRRRMLLKLFYTARLQKQAKDMEPMLLSGKLFFRYIQPFVLIILKGILTTRIQWISLLIIRRKK